MFFEIFYYTAEMSWEHIYIGLADVLIALPRSKFIKTPSLADAQHKI